MKPADEAIIWACELTILGIRGGGGVGAGGGGGGEAGLFKHEVRSGTTVARWPNFMPIKSKVTLTNYKMIAQK